MTLELYSYAEKFRRLEASDLSGRTLLLDSVHTDQLLRSYRKKVRALWSDLSDEEIDSVPLSSLLDPDLRAIKLHGHQRSVSLVYRFLMFGKDRTGRRLERWVQYVDGVFVHFWLRAGGERIDLTAEQAPLLPALDYSKGRRISKTRAETQGGYSVTIAGTEVRMTDREKKLLLTVLEKLR